MVKNTTKKTHRQKKKVDYYEIVTNKIIELLKQGVPLWRKPWSSYGLAKNYASGHVYKGINMLMLNLIAPYDIPLYMSRKQIKDKGGCIKKGSTAQWVYYYGDYYKDASNNTVPFDQVEQRSAMEQLQHIRFLKARPVYNVSCLEGIEITIPQRLTYDHDPIEECEVLVQEMRQMPDFAITESDKAFYCRENDHIRIPNMKYFTASEEYYCTFFHEMVHWTGHSSRLNREGITSKQATFGSKLYAEEELIAEMGASYLCNLTGIDRAAVTQNSAAYLQSWITRLKEDKNLIFRVAAKAQQAVDLITLPY